MLATLRDRLRSGDVWVERSANYRRFDAYLLPQAAVPAAAAALGLPATADEWLAAKGQELDTRLKRDQRHTPRCLRLRAHFAADFRRALGCKAAIKLFSEGAVACS